MRGRRPDRERQTLYEPTRVGNLLNRNGNPICGFQRPEGGGWMKVVKRYKLLVRRSMSSQDVDTP